MENEFTDVAFVTLIFDSERLVANRLVAVALSKNPLTEYTLDEVALVSTAFVEYSVVAVRAVDDASPRVVFPVTSRVDAKVVAPVTLSSP